MEYPRGCSDCECCRALHDEFNWWFYGCFHSPYKGKWIVEIKKCPKEKEDTK